jgi:hypothetical protein
VCKKEQRGNTDAAANQANRSLDPQMETSAQWSDETDFMTGKDLG